MSNKPDVRIFISRDNSRDISEGQYFAEVCQVDAKGKELEGAEPLITTEFCSTETAARRAAIEAWLAYEY